jgi:DNA primase
VISTVLPAWKYLIEERKLNESTIRTFHLGYVDHSGEVYLDADYQGKLPQLDKRFYHSTMFPIQDVYGSTVAVSCRPLGPSSTKYINTTYEKADHLYGLYQNYKEILKTQKVYVVEGNLSMLTPWQAGIKNIVALLGSNISHTQLCLISRFAKSVCFVPDGDKAGNNFIAKMKENIPSKFYDADLKFSFIQLPPKTDPDDYVKKFGSFLSIPEQELIV